MVKKITILLLMITVSSAVFSQSYRMRHARGTMAGDLNFGLTKNGTAIEIGVIDFLSSEIQQLGFIGYEWGKVGTTDYNLIELSYLRQLSLYELNQNFYLNVFGGGSMGYETVKNKFLDKKEHVAVPGLAVGVEIESYITNKIVGLVKFKEHYRFNSNMGKWSYTFQIGCRYLF